MNVQILMSKGAGIAFECLRAACIWLRSSGIWPGLVIRLRECAEDAFSRRSYSYYPTAAATLLLRRRLSGGSSIFWLRHSFVIPHSDFVINISG